MKKILAAAMREYRATALTWAFVIGGVVAPLAIWGIIAAVTATGVLSDEREPLTGTVAVYDSTQNQSAVEGIRQVFDPAIREARAEAMAEQVEAMSQRIGLGGMVPPAILEQQIKAAISRLERDVDVEVATIESPAEIEAQKQRVKSGELLAVIEVTEQSLQLPGAGDEGDPEEADGEGEAIDPNTYRITHSTKIDADYLNEIREAVRSAIQNERYRRLDMDPNLVIAIQSNSPRSVSSRINEQGDEVKSDAGFQKALPFIFLMLLMASVVTGGNYLLMGTLEEKQSRVMEVLLSAVSPTQLLIGKMLGQGLVGLTVLSIYGTLGFLAASRFNVLSALPSDPFIIVVLILYFLIAYLMLGGMMTAIGAAINDYREAQALFAPITASLIIPVVVLFTIMDNPASIVARITSYFPPTTPFVMAMRLSQPAYPVPLWEIILTLIIGFAGVAVVIWAAAKIFRIGVLMYGKPPSLLGLLKWLRNT